jgi:phosphoribosylformylglycinamidine synthase
VIKNVLKQPVEYIWHQERSLEGFDCIILPGGFSYGDYLRVGAIARFSPAMESLEEFARAGGLVLGICNGFQILVEAGLLPGALIRNQSLKFRCHETYLRVENVDTPFTNQGRVGQVIKVPIAHGEGNYFADEATLAELEANGQVLFRYCNQQGEVVAAANPNGSLNSIAGICNREKNILGMMPHPERCSEAALGNLHGLMIFESLLRWGERGGSFAASS